MKKGTKYPARMAARTAEVRAVGAWVQPESAAVHKYFEAVHSARAEESRLQQERADKEMRLRQFQEDVKKRVSELARLKRQHELEKSYKAVEDERNIVRQTFHAAERVTPRKNRCYLRNSDDLAIQLRKNGSLGQEALESDSRQKKEFERQKDELLQLNRKARRNLMSRRLATEQDDDLPGGHWRQSGQQGGSQNQVIDLECDSNVDTLIIKGNAVTEIPIDADRTIPKTVQFEDESQASEDITTEYRVFTKSGSDDDQKYTTDGLLNGVSHHKNYKSKRKGSSQISSIPVINPGILDEEEKKRVVKQRAMYRRLFMDLEREQVKESLRRKEHRHKISQLKKAKEEERKEAEKELKRESTPVDPLTGETLEETLLREQEEEALMRLELELSSIRSQKLRESERYLEALRQNLREKLETKKIELPPLCACGASVWDTNPQMCANNCVFYHNPRAYAKALQSLLASCDVA